MPPSAFAHRTAIEPGQDAVLLLAPLPGRVPPLRAHRDRPRIAAPPRPSRPPPRPENGQPPVRARGVPARHRASVASAFHRTWRWLLIVSRQYVTLMRPKLARHRHSRV